MNAPEGAPPHKILVIRHGEKPTPLGPAGIKEDGREDDHSLVVRGWQRAGALASYFCYPRDRAVACPTKVYSPPTHGKAGTKSKWPVARIKNGRDSGLNKGGSLQSPTDSKPRRCG